MKFMTVFILIFCGFSQAFAEETYGLLMIVKGQVQIIKLNASPVSAKVGAKVYQQDTIVTGKDSRAKIVMSDRNIINVLPETRLRIDQYISNVKEKNVRLSLIEGKVRSNVEQQYDGSENKFEIKTPSAVAGVRGTQFVTGYRKSTNSTTVITFRGEVVFQGLDVKSNKLSDAVMVKKGEISENTDGRIPGSPVKINPTELKKTDKETTVRKDVKSDIQQVALPKNDIAPILGIRDRNDNLLGDSAKQIINRPAKVNIVIK